MGYLPYRQSSTNYCRKHGIDYSGYICPECAADRERETTERRAKEEKKARFQALLDSVFAQNERRASGLADTSLLGVKMFLADVRSWRQQYKEGEYVCADFARDVYEAATTKGIRCAYVAIGFAKSEVGHAVVAFETDHGLTFFEPQTGDQEDVIVGSPYSTRSQGTPDDDVVRTIRISWNDGTTLTLE